MGQLAPGRRVPARKRVTHAAHKTLVDPVAALGSLLERLMAFRNGAATLKPCSLVFNADIAADKVRLAVMLYSPDYSFVCAGHMTGENLELFEILRMATDNTYVPTAKRREAYTRRRQAKFEGTFSMLYRIRSQKNVTFLSAAIGVESRSAHVPHTYQELLSFFFSGSIQSMEWVEEFIPFALEYQPPCPFDEIPGFGISAFDNLQIRVGYKAFSTEDTRGETTNYTLDMTNWMTFQVPRHLGAHLRPMTLENIGARPSPEPVLPSRLTLDSLTQPSRCAARLSALGTAVPDRPLSQQLLPGVFN